MTREHGEFGSNGATGLADVGRKASRRVREAWQHWYAARGTSRPNGANNNHSTHTEHSGATKASTSSTVARPQRVECHDSDKHAPGIADALEGRCACKVDATAGARISSAGKVYLGDTIGMRGWDHLNGGVLAWSTEFALLCRNHLNGSTLAWLAPSAFVGRRCHCAFTPRHGWGHVCWIVVFAPNKRLRQRLWLEMARDGYSRSSTHKAWFVPHPPRLCRTCSLSTTRNARTQKKRQSDTQSEPFGKSRLHRLSVKFC